MTENNATRREWTVTGMDCASCAVKITKAVEGMPGVTDVKVALMAERLSLNLAPGTTDPATVETAVRRLGFGIADRNHARTGRAECGHKHGHGHGHEHEREHGHEHEHEHEHEHGRGRAHGAAADEKPPYATAAGRAALFTGALLATAWIVETTAPAEIGYWAFVAACLIGAAPVAVRAFRAASIGQFFTIESLMTAAVAGALTINAAEEAATVVFLFAVGEALEGVAAGKARAGIRALADLVPKTALVEIDGRIREIPADALAVGQTALVRPGDRIPADGVVVEGVSGVDESPVTGESVPKTKSPGDAVFAGSINAEAVLRVTATKAAADNTIARIIRLVEEAEEARAPTERFIDRFSRRYMPAVVLAAALTILVPPLATGAPWDVWIYRGLALLLIGCPCALVVSVPASVAAALSAGTRRGLLMKGGAVIEAAASVKRVAFDKTGTLTHGKPVVVDAIPAAGVDAETLLSTAAGVESGSNHPLALAVLRRAAADGIPVPPMRDARILPGLGVEATVDGTPAWVASPRRAAETGGIDADGLRRVAELEAEGKTVVVVHRENRPLGLLALRDEPREDAAEAVRELKALGVDVVMLTGDNPRTAAAVADRLGVARQADMLPEDKLSAVRAMSADGGVMMIGDGVNDAPALKQASVGVAMGSGTDTALETADAALLRDRIGDAPALIRLARAAMRNIHVNVAVALGLKAAFLVAVVAGYAGLWVAVLADTGATVLVTLNALRLLRFDPTRPATR